MAEKKATATNAKVPVVQSRQTEVMLGKAAQSLEQSINRMTEGLDHLQKFQSTIGDLDLQVVNKQSEIKALDEALKEKRERGEIELELALKQNEKTAITAILTKQGLVVIPADQLSALEGELAKLKTEFDKNVKAEVAKVEAAITRNADQASKLKEMEFQKQQAENTATIKMLTEKVNFLGLANKDLQDQLKSALDANVKIAEAAGKGGSNITLGGGK